MTSVPSAVLTVHFFLLRCARGRRPYIPATHLVLCANANQVPAATKLHLNMSLVLAAHFFPSLRQALKPRPSRAQACCWKPPARLRTLPCCWIPCSPSQVEVMRHLQCPFSSTHAWGLVSIEGWSPSFQRHPKSLARAAWVGQALLDTAQVCLTGKDQCTCFINKAEKRT